ncbi:4641_t:CDS:2 [Paraglomus brasilianum]|uniref:4641_t:CDS:1 n=1 Tax=Paraglomus brasilianum TaxID=144538 RepID=A0A9N9B5N3_9GLOM|nr:4641_t:CDS:2 [Paraglomus brasilianum]
MPQEPKAKKKRVPITALTKQEICLKKRDNGKLRDEDLAREYGLDRSTITKILKQRERWLSIDPTSNHARQKTQKSPKFPQIESALADWLTMAVSNGEAVSDAQLQQKALEFAQMYGLRNEFQASNGWISKFKTRHHQPRNNSDTTTTNEVSLSVSQPQTVPGTSVLSSSEHQPYINLTPTTSYTTPQSSRTNGATTISMGPPSGSPLIHYPGTTSNTLGNPFTPSRMFTLDAMSHFSLDNTAFVFCDYQNDVIAMYQNNASLNQCLTKSRNLFRSVHQHRQKKNLAIISVGVCFRQGYPEVSPHNAHFLMWKQFGRLVEGTKGAEFIDGLVPHEGDIVIKKRRIDAFYNTELKMVLESRNIRQVVLAGIDTGGVVLATMQSAADRDFKVVVVRDCCFDASESVQNTLMEEVLPKYGVMVVNLETIMAMLRV